MRVSSRWGEGRGQAGEREGLEVMLEPWGTTEAEQHRGPALGSSLPLPLRVEHRPGRLGVGQEKAEGGVQEVGTRGLPADRRPAGFLLGTRALPRPLEVEA